MAKFKVGDKVRFDKDSIGVILKVNPTLSETGIGLGRNKTYDYLVQYTFTFDDGDTINFEMGFDEHRLDFCNSYRIRERLGIQ